MKYLTCEWMFKKVSIKNDSQYEQLLSLTWFLHQILTLFSKRFNDLNNYFYINVEFLKVRMSKFWLIEKMSKFMKWSNVFEMVIGHSQKTRKYSNFKNDDQITSKGPLFWHYLYIHVKVHLVKELQDGHPHIKVLSNTAHVKVHSMWSNHMDISPKFHKIVPSIPNLKNHPDRPISWNTCTRKSKPSPLKIHTCPTCHSPNTAKKNPQARKFAGKKFHRTPPVAREKMGLTPSAWHRSILLRYQLPKRPGSRFARRGTKSVALQYVDIYSPRKPRATPRQTRGHPQWWGRRSKKRGKKGKKRGARGEAADCDSEVPTAGNFFQRGLRRRALPNKTGPWSVGQRGVGANEIARNFAIFDLGWKFTVISGHFRNISDIFGKLPQVTGS